MACLCQVATTWNNDSARLLPHPLVIAGRDPAIQINAKDWTLGSSPGKTKEKNGSLIKCGMTGGEIRDDGKNARDNKDGAQDFTFSLTT